MAEKLSSHNIIIRSIRTNAIKCAVFITVNHMINRIPDEETFQDLFKDIMHYTSLFRDNYLYTLYTSLWKRKKMAGLHTLMY